MMNKLRVFLILILIVILSSEAYSDDSSLHTSPTNLNQGLLEQQLQEVLLEVEFVDDKIVKEGSLLHLRLVPDDGAMEALSVYSRRQDPPMMNRFYMYAYRYASNANLIAVQIPEIDMLQTEAHRQIRRMNEPLMESLLRSALGRAAGEFVLNDAMDQDTVNWAQAPSVTAEGFRQRIRPGMQFNVRGSLQGVGAAVRYNVAGISISTAYGSQNQGMEPIRFARPFSTDWNRGEFGIDTRGNLWLSFVGRW